MQNVEVRAGSVAEAVAQALAQLGKDEDEALIEVLSQSADSALVRVSIADDEGDDALADYDDGAAEAMPRRRRRIPQADDDTVERARTILEELLQHMDVHALVTPVVQEVVGPDGNPEQSLTLHIEGVDEETTGLMIGRRGETLRSMQYLLNVLIHRQAGRWSQVVIDIGQYRQRRQDSIEGLALRMAERVRQSGRPMPLEAMSSYERRIIHMVLREDPTVYTESSGEGEHRRIVIYPKR